MPVRNKPSIPQLIDNLSFVKTIDLMLLEGTPVADVVKFIQDDQEELTSINPGSLLDALAKRRRKLRQESLDRSAEQTKNWFASGFGSTEDEDEDDDDDESEDVTKSKRFGLDHDYLDNPNVPQAISRKIYERHVQGGIDELIEMEALYRSQLTRIGRLYHLEEKSNGYIDSLHREYKAAETMLMARVAIKDKMGLIDGDKKFREQLDIDGYSEDTVKVLSNPESRRRVVSLVEKLTRIERKKSEQEQEKKVG